VNQLLEQLDDGTATAAVAVPSVALNLVRSAQKTAVGHGRHTSSDDDDDDESYYDNEDEEDNYYVEGTEEEAGMAEEEEAG